VSSDFMWEGNNLQREIFRGKMTCDRFFLRKTCALIFRFGEISPIDLSRSRATRKQRFPGYTRID